VFILLPPLAAKKIADRHFGIGGDQILLLRKATLPTCDVVMAVYNNDGSRAEMCGNGVRCAAKYWYDRVLKRDITKRSIRFETLAGTVISAPCEVEPEVSY
jgi:diaminopimelate epimerase